MSFVTTSSLVFLAAFLTQNLLTLNLNKIEYMRCSFIKEQVVKNQSYFISSIDALYCHAFISAVEK